MHTHTKSRSEEIYARSCGVSSLSSVRVRKRRYSADLRRTFRKHKQRKKSTKPFRVFFRFDVFVSTSHNEEEARARITSLNTYVTFIKMFAVQQSFATKTVQVNKVNKTTKASFVQDMKKVK
jgi:hypothetical protein